MKLPCEPHWKEQGHGFTLRLSLVLWALGSGHGRLVSDRGTIPTAALRAASAGSKPSLYTHRYSVQSFLQGWGQGE